MTAKALLGLPTGALQMRCISGGFDGLSLSTDGTDAAQQKSLTPCGDKGLGNDCQPLALADKMKAAGIECESAQRELTWPFPFVFEALP